MQALKDYNVVFSGLALGVHEFDFDVKQSFFESFDYAEFDDIEVKVRLELEKQKHLLNLQFKLEGSVSLPCDRCGEALNLPLSSEEFLVIKFSDHHKDEGDELIVLPDSAYQINVAQHIYEYINLAVPAKRVHDTNCEDWEAAEDIEEQEEENNVDPRWKALEQLKNR